MEPTVLPFLAAANLSQAVIPHLARLPKSHWVFCFCYSVRCEYGSPTPMLPGAGITLKSKIVVTLRHGNCSNDDGLLQIYQSTVLDMAALHETYQSTPL